MTDSRSAQGWSFTVLGLLAIATIAWLAMENLSLKRSVQGMTRPATEAPAGLNLGDTISLAGLGEVNASTRRGGGAENGTTLAFFFTTRCPYCVRSFDNIELLRSNVGDGVSVIGIAMDGSSLSRDNMPDAVSRWRILAPSSLEVANALRVPRVPTTVLLNSDLTVVAVWIGEVTEATASEIAEAINNLAEGDD